jgi:fructose-bisphosphate aldolase class II
MKYLKESKVHIFAPAVGTAHGFYLRGPISNFELVNQIKRVSEVPIVIHGGTGLDESDFKRFVKNGASKINISTAIKHAYMDSMKAYLEKHIKMDCVK